MRVTKDLFEKHVKSFSAGQTIFSEGDRGEELYVVIDGKVEIRKSTYSTSAKTLINLSKGDIFGEMALIEKKARSATAVAVKETQLLVMDDTLFEHMIETNSDFAKKIIRILSERLRRTNSVLQGLMVSNKEKIIIKGLNDYADEYGTPTIKGYRVNKERFLEWACSHLGVRNQDLELVIDRLIDKEVITPSSLGEEEFVLPNRT